MEEWSMEKLYDLLQGQRGKAPGPSRFGAELAAATGKKFSQAAIDVWFREYSAYLEARNEASILKIANMLEPFPTWRNVERAAIRLGLEWSHSRCIRVHARLKVERPDLFNVPESNYHIRLRGSDITLFSKIQGIYDLTYSECASMLVRSFLDGVITQRLELTSHLERVSDLTGKNAELLSKVLDIRLPGKKR
jgi:hypothetical protein